MLRCIVHCWVTREGGRGYGLRLGILLALLIISLLPSQLATVLLTCEAQRRWGGSGLVRSSPVPVAFVDLKPNRCESLAAGGKTSASMSESSCAGTGLLARVLGSLGGIRLTVGWNACLQVTSGWMSSLSFLICMCVCRIHLADSLRCLQRRLHNKGLIHRTLQ